MYRIIITFILAYWLEIIASLGIVGVLLILYKRGREDLVRKMILSFVVDVEKKLGSGTGELKYAAVVERLYDKLPWVLRMLYSKKQVNGMIEEAVEYLKRYLSDGKNLLGYGEDAGA
ncbi:MAG: hypothetical protein K0R93_1058 [Anaerosolibacter sp.]|jgi:hypothetical protein|uniref:hypothetical protein n=1 Tax=Anaerosolibacter sp. TaxID=1872527 RepID=UPI002622DF78|nr:hypothetical protein [Anaerosolibacter sp.]MDF2546160.1 hypothetical protein [Anaerosolibacter sp.]